MPLEDSHQQPPRQGRALGLCWVLGRRGEKKQKPISHANIGCASIQFSGLAAGPRFPSPWSVDATLRTHDAAEADELLEMQRHPINVGFAWRTVGNSWTPGRQENGLWLLSLVVVFRVRGMSSGLCGAGRDLLTTRAHGATKKGGRAGEGGMELTFSSDNSSTTLSQGQPPTPFRPHRYDTTH